jgi:hypothetical protein
MADEPAGPSLTEPSLHLLHQKPHRLRPPTACLLTTLCGLQLPLSGDRGYTHCAQHAPSCVCPESERAIRPSVTADRCDK